VSSDLGAAMAYAMMYAFQNTVRLCLRFSHSKARE